MIKIKVFIVACMLLACAAAGAVDRHFCECSTGAHGSCVAGNNANAGTSSSAPKQNLSGFNIEGLAAGDRILFCQGGVFELSSHIQIDSIDAATPTNPVVFTDYTPPSGATGTPILRRSGNGLGFQIGGFFGSVVHGGYTFRNLEIDGGEEGTWGFWVNPATTHLTIENVTLHRWNIAVHISLPHSGAPGAPNSTNTTIRDSRIVDNRDMGMLGGSRNMLVERNEISRNNAGGGPLSHGLYLGCSNSDCSNSIVRYNRFERNSVTDGRCQGGNMTFHGLLNGLLIEGNVVEQDASDPGCLGISLTAGYDEPDEVFRRVTIRGNRVINLGACGICVNSAPGVVIENNVITHTTTDFHLGIDVITGFDDSVPTTNAVIRNNTVYMAAPGSGSIGIASSSNTGHRVFANLVFFGSGASASHRCFETSAYANYQGYNNNLCYLGGSNGTWSQTYNTLSAAQAAGFDPNGFNTNPSFASTPSSPLTWSCNVQAGSPVINAGGASAARLAFGGYLANGSRDIGACEYGSTP